jgi:solute carrier family 25 (adenine nucleotide translocator) protein 4/5/6/31
MGKDKNSSNFIIDFLTGALSSAIAKTAVAPVERIKALLQTQAVNEQLKKKGIKFNGIVDCFRKTVKDTGFLSLWRGNSATLARYIPLQAINLSLKDQFRRIFITCDREENHLKYALGSILAGGFAGSCG